MKNSEIAFMIVGLVCFSVLLFLIVTYEKPETEINETVNETEDRCMIWILNGDGNGFGTDVIHCKILERNCEDYIKHSLPCVWIDDRLSGCECKLR